MPRRCSIPSYRRHKRSGQAIVTFSDRLGRRRDYLLGKFDTTASRAEYARLVAEWAAAGQNRLPGTVDQSSTSEMMVGEVALAFLKDAAQYYRRPNGTVTNELDEYRRALRPMTHLYGQDCLK